MATKKKLTDLNTIPNIADGDLLHIVDVSDESQDTEGSSKKVTIEQLRAEIGGGAVDSVNGQTGEVELDSDDIVEGGVNLYFTNARFDTRFDTSFDTRLATKSTSNLNEGSNLYFTTSRVLNTALTGLNIAGTNIVSTDTVLQAFGKVQNQINSVIGGVSYQGIWNATTNSPSITSGVGTKGHYYVVSVAGSTNLDGITDWKLGDWAIFNGSAWEKVDNTDAVISVNGFIGAVVLSTADVAENTNLYFTNNRAINALTGQNISIFNNDTGFITSSSLSPYAKLDASNQPFTGNLNILKGSPRYSATENVDNATIYMEKLPTNNEGRLVSQNRPYISGGAVTTSSVNHGGTFSNTLSNWSIAFWIRTTDSAQNMFAGNTANNTKLLVYHESNGFNLRVEGSSIASISNSTIYDGNWHHVVFAIAKNATSYVYFDGVQLGSSFTAPNFDAVFTHILRGGTGSIARGTFDEYIVYDSQISAGTVASLYGAGAPVKLTNYTGVYAAYHFDTGSGTTYVDGSGNGRNATAVSTPVWTTGKVATITEALEDIVLISNKNNGTHNSYGTYQIGHYNSTKGTSNVYEGLSHQFNLLGSTILRVNSTYSLEVVTGNIKISTESTPKLIFGTSGSDGTYISRGASNQDIQIFSSGTQRASFGLSGVAGIYVGSGTAGSEGLVSSAGFYSPIRIRPRTAGNSSVKGGDLILEGGGASSSGNWNGGDILLDGGLLNGSGLTGRVLIGTTRATLVGIGLTNPKAVLHSAVSVAGGTHNASLVINNLNAGTGGLSTGPYTGIDFSHLNNQSNDIQRKMAIGFEKITTFSRGDMVISLNGTASDANVSYLTDEKLRLTMAGLLGIGTVGSTITAMLDINSDVIRLRTAKTPASATATGNQGDICWDSSYIYVATGANTWKRGAIASW